ncbi:hypothetical protein [Natrinema versiforme]|uniref:Conjugation protein n=1 Tax=Natrinema versiforme JCM 10478 TaxID=1227496 RepID=L9XNL8_9EURY|nr:conjugation protein [Natrinema versiforme JCM 10478]
MNDDSAELLAFEEFVETEAQQNALATRLDITAETARKLLDENLTKAEVLDAVTRS